MKRNEYILHDDYCELRVLYLNKIIISKIDIEDIELCKKYTWHYHNGYL